MFSCTSLQHLCNGKEHGFGLIKYHWILWSKLIPKKILAFCLVFPNPVTSIILFPLLLVPPVYDVDPIFTVVEGATNFRVTPSLEAFPIPAEGNFTWTSGGIQLVSGMGGVTFGVDFIEFDEVNRDLEGTTYEVQGSNVAGVDSTSFQLSVLCK